jgi:hypothetical protein
MTTSTPVEPNPIEPKFPGGWDLAPEITGRGGCAHSACSCIVEPGRTHCCLACSRAREESADCACGHFGCTRRAY